jgi:hypothetical protein
MWFVSYCVKSIVIHPLCSRNVHTYMHACMMCLPEQAHLQYNQIFEANYVHRSCFVAKLESHISCWQNLQPVHEQLGSCALVTCEAGCGLEGVGVLVATGQSERAVLDNLG